MSKISQKIIELVESNAFRTFKAKEFQRLLNVPHHKYQALRAALRELERSGRLVKVKKNKAPQ